MPPLATENPYQQGNFAPVAEEITAYDLAVDGVIPPELNGRLLRIGPNPVMPEDPATYHWFTGTGMVHGVRLRGGRAEWYRNRFVRSDRVTEAKGWPEVPGPRGALGDGTANTNVIGHAGETWAIVEAGGLPVQLSHELETIARSDFDGTLNGSFTAHPKADPVTGELHAVTYYWEWDHLRYVVVGTDGTVRREVQIPVPGRPMVHDMGLTERYVVVLDLPVTFDLDAAMSGRRFPYLWDPAYGARVGLLPRDGDAGDIRWCELPQNCYVFHPVNAYEAGDGTVVMDVCRYDSVFRTDVRGPNDGRATLHRWVIDPVAGQVREQQLHDDGEEFPRHDERLVGRPYRYGYTVAVDNLQFGGIRKHDLRTGAVEVHDFGRGRMAMEAVFVPARADAAEDDGWLMSYVYDRATDRSDVMILAAQDVAGPPAATIHLPQRVPFGFHGNWVPEQG